MSSTIASLNVRPITRLFRALGDETRLRIFALLTHGELCVCHIEMALSLSQPSASRQLGILRTAEIVEPRREGSWIYYRLTKQANHDCKAILRILSRSFATEETIRRDVARLLKVKGPGSCQ
jgi:ArsR family transcriptional regulator, arsenate/arsenite/antimonite-responsive transcriptional repressor